VLELGRETSAARDPRFAGKAVFVGFSEQLQPEQKDGFYTVFSEASGLDLSGVEIAATAFANLLDRRFVAPLGTAAELWLLALWGLAIGAALTLAPARGLAPLALGFAAAYLAVAHGLFASRGQWLPLVVPLLVQLPLGVLGALASKYREARRDRRIMREAFGYHLPGEVIDRLLRGLQGITGPGRLAYGICLASDAGQYTRLSELLPPAELRDFMNRYYETLFMPVRRAEGVVSDVVGDAMLAIWASPSPRATLRHRACAAAAEIAEAVQRFNRGEDRRALPTRIGLHCGEVVLGHVGAVDHYEYRAVGDIVNTATRIEALNKQLGTSILASGEVIEGLEGLYTRYLGCFLLPGKTHPVRVHEILGPRERLDADLLSAYDRFAIGVRAFYDGRWSEAARDFGEVLAAREDGPSRYYLGVLEGYGDTPPDRWDGALRIAVV
jgi:adenylate cyclase